MASIKNLKLRRLRNGITQAELAEHFGTSTSWIRQVESYYRGPGFREWAEKYGAALDELIESKKGR